MIDTLKFFKNEYDSSSFYSKFKNQIASIHDEQFIYADRQAVVDRFRAICMPPEDTYDHDNNEFLLLCFWLNKNGYMIKEFPNILSRPESLRDFAYNDFRRYIEQQRGPRDKVQWSERRILCSSMSITTNLSFQLIPNEVEDKIRLISTRGAEFDSMPVDEKLQNLNNLIENLLKPTNEGGYITVDYNNVFFGFISEDDVKRFRKRTQAFRHASEETLQERASIPEDEKVLLSELGVFIVVQLHKHFDKPASDL